jgi:hypothetical protein
MAESGVVVDGAADGRILALPRITTRMRSLLPVAILLIANLQLPTVCAEPLLVPIVPPSAVLPMNQRDVRTAADGDMALAIWLEGNGAGRLLGARLGPGGPIDRSGLPIAAESDAAEYPAIAGTSDGWLVAWPSGKTIHLRHIDHDGIMEPIVELAKPTDQRCRIRLAVNLSRVLVMDSCGETTIVSPHGTPIVPWFTLPVAWYGSFSIARDPAGFLVVATSPDTSTTPKSDGLGAWRISVDGAVGARIPLLQAEYPINGVATAYDGSVDVIAWQNGGIISTLTLAPGEETVHVTGTLIHSYNSDLELSVSSEGTWLTYGGSYGPFLTVRLMEGVPAGEPLTLPGSKGLSIAQLEGVAAVVWISSSTSGGRVMGALVDVDIHSVGPLFPIAKNAPDVSETRIAAVGDAAYAVWLEAYGEERSIAVGGVTLAGSRLPRSGWTVSGQHQFARSPAIAVGTRDLLVTWYEDNGHGGQLVGRRVSPSLVPLDEQPFLIADRVPTGGTTIAFDGTNWLVLFLRHDPGLASAVFGVRVSQTGAVLDPVPIPISPESWLNALNIAAAWDGSSFLCLWESSKDVRLTGMSSIGSARLGSDGVVISQTQLTPEITDQRQLPHGTRPSSPRLGKGETSMLVTWDQLCGITALRYGLPASPGAAPRTSNRSRAVARPSVPFSLCGFGSPVVIRAADGFDLFHQVHDSSTGPPGNRRTTIKNDGSIVTSSFPYNVAEATVIGETQILQVWERLDDGRYIWFWLLGD